MSYTTLARQTSTAVALAVLLLALPGCKSDSDSGTAAGSTITVSGKVITVGQQPIPNSPVVITGLPATVTDANGAFTITGVTTPYDVTVVVSATKLGITYRGLTRSDPTLVNLLSASTPGNTATVSGTVSGGAGFPQPATRTSAVLLTSTETSSSTIPNGTTGVYSLSTSWVGATTITTVLHALQWDKNAAGVPTAYTGYGEKTGVSVTAGGSFAAQNVAMTAVTAQTVAGTVTVPAGLTLSSKAVSLVFATKGSISLGSEGGSTASFSYAVPVVSGTTLSVSASASGVSGLSQLAKSGIAPGASGIALSLQAVSTHSLPVDNATGVTVATPFSWTPSPSVIYIVLVNGPAGQPDFLIITSQPSATLPDLTALGLGLPKGIAYGWSILTYGPHASIDAAAGPTGFIPQGDIIATSSMSRAMTTAP